MVGLDNEQNNFERNKIDSFGVQCEDLGNLQKINIGHDNSGFGASWFLDKIIITSQKTNQKWYFLVGDWLEGNNNRRDVAGVEADGIASLPLVPYKISVTTGDVRGAGTDANVFIVMYGDQGDSGKRVLDGPGNLFERKQTDEFGLTLVDLGDLKKIRIGHDDAGFGSSWYLDKIIITNEKTQQTWYFLCGKWLAKDEGDGSIERELPAGSEDGVVSAPYVSYKITVVTGDRRGAGTDANVYIVLYGTQGDSGDRKLESGGNNFERNQTDVFGFDALDLGDISKIKIYHDNTGIGAGWFLDKVIVQSGKGERWFFPCGKWFADDEDDKLISREIDAQVDDSVTYTPLVTYRIEVFTGDRSGAGTDASVTIELYGENGKSGLRVLDNSQDNFERNKVDAFGIETSDIGKIQKINIGHDNSGFGASWFLDKVVITSEKSQEKYFFLLGDWLEGQNNRKELVASDQDGNPSAPLVAYRIEVITGDRRGAGTDANVSIVLYGETSDSGKRILDGPGNLFERSQTDTFGFKILELGELKKIRIGHDDSGFGSSWFLDKVIVTNEKTEQKWFFLCGKWLAKNEEDGLIEREIPAGTEDGQTTMPMVNYKILVTTGDRRGAGTDANVLLTIFGSQGESGERQLESGGNNFERDQTDYFGIECVDLGEIQRIVVRHDNSGIGASWFLDKVVIETGQGDRFFFSYVVNGYLTMKEINK